MKNTKSFLEVAVTPVGAEAVSAVKLAVLVEIILFVDLKNCFLKYVVSSVVKVSTLKFAIAFSVTNAVELPSVNSESFDISLTRYPFNLNEPVTSAEPVN